MIIQCQSCAAKYFLPEEKAPAHPLKVRCPKCRAVFMLAPRVEPVAVGAAVGAPEAPARPAEKARPAPRRADNLTEAAAAPAAPADAKERPARGGGRSSEDRAKRLARVLVSDILWYNREKRDLALRDGTLMTTLGDEIKKSWELYKEKVGPEAAHSTNYFKEALNEILADGQEVF
jgi:predicted Zn finger-like uncharacterized protein